MSEARHFMLMTVGPIGTVPAAAGSSVAMALWGIAGRLRAAGHRVSMCYILPRYCRHTAEDWAELARRKAVLEQLQIPIDVIGTDHRPPRRWLRLLQAFRTALFPRVGDFFPEVAYAKQIELVCNARRPDVIYHHGTSSLIAVHRRLAVPTVILTGDLEEELVYYRWKLTPISSFARYVYHLCLWLGSRRLAAIRAQRLRECQVVLSNAHRAVAVLAREADGVEYMPTPCAVNDLGGVCLAPGNDAPKTDRPRLLMLGHLGGTPTQLGLHFLADHVLPHLERRLGPTGFEVHILGRDPLTAQLQRKLDRASVRLRGYVDDLVATYRQTDVMLAATPVPTGVRTRIAEALSAGCCIVAHQAEAEGMPELVHQQNALLARNGADFAEAVIQALGDPALRRRLGAAARETYDRYFAPSVALTRLVERITHVGGRP